MFSPTRLSIEEMKLFSTLNMNRPAIRDNTTVEAHLRKETKVRTREGICSECGVREIIDESYFGAMVHDFLCFSCVHSNKWGVRAQIATSVLRESAHENGLKGVLPIVWLFANSNRVIELSNLVSTHVPEQGLLVCSMQHFVQRGLDVRKMCSSCQEPIQLPFATNFAPMVTKFLDPRYNKEDGAEVTLCLKCLQVLLPLIEHLCMATVLKVGREPSSQNEERENRSFFLMEVRRLEKMPRDRTKISDTLSLRLPTRNLPFVPPNCSLMGSDFEEVHMPETFDHAVREGRTVTTISVR